MSQTARDTITRAMRMLGVVLGGEVPNATEATNGLAALNAMMHGWKGQGVDIGHIDLALGDNLDVADEHINATTALLAAELSSEFLVQVPSAVAVSASNGWSALQATYTALNDPQNDSTAEVGLRRMSANRRGLYPYRP